MWVASIGMWCAALVLFVMGVGAMRSIVRHADDEPFNGGLAAFTFAMAILVFAASSGVAYLAVLIWRA